MIIFFLEIENPELPLDHASQTRHFNVPHRLLADHSLAILKILRRKQGHGDFDVQDLIGWIPGVSNTKKTFRNWAVYIMPFLNSLAGPRNQKASDLAALASLEIWQLMSHWFCWVEEDASLALISSIEEAQNLIKFAEVIGASKAYITALEHYEVFLGEA